MMLKRIHFAKPTIKYDEYQKHAQEHDRLKDLIRTNGSRYAMVEAARHVILKGSNKVNTKRD